MKRPTELFHYSNKPVELTPKEYFMKDVFMRDDTGMKPYGLWVSIEDYQDDQTWKTWCEGENFRLRHLTHRHKIILKENANILVLSTKQELIDLSIKYAFNDVKEFQRIGDQFRYLRNREERDLPYVYRMNWREIKKLYDGIFIAPYIWEARFCTCATWYYPWDCASGCIWNIDCIQSFELFEITADKSLGKNTEEENDWDLPREAFDQRA